VGALSDRQFRRLLAGNALSSFGDSALYLSLGIWAKDLTGSNAAAGPGVFDRLLSVTRSKYATHGCASPEDVQ
jgi:hypothetical protein